MKAAFKLLLLAAIIVYLIFAFTRFTRQGDQTICQQINYTIADSSHAGFITRQEAEHILRQSAAYPVGKSMDKVDILAIEQVFKKNIYIDSVSCYKSPGGIVNILIEQRLPLLRVIADTGEQYYIDGKGQMMNLQGYVADLIVVTGHVSPMYAKKNLVKLGTFLRDDDFWNNQIEQINVLADGTLQLVPRVGSHIIQFGGPDNISSKFRNLYTFYEKVMPEVGWNKYSIISVEHPTQIVGKKAKS